MSSGSPAVLRDALLNRAAVDPDLLAFAHRGERITFAELAERADARGGALQRAGVGRGDRVAIVMSPGIALTEVFWAVQLTGAVPCIFNPFVPIEVLTRRLQRIRPRLVVSDEVAREMHLGANAGEADAGPEDLALLQLTSGTSGDPRASMILQRNVMTYLHAQALDRQFDREDVFVAWVPPWHDLGLVGFVIGAVYHGSSCHLVDPAINTIPAWLQTISEVRGTVSAAPDFALRLAARMIDPSSVDLGSLRFMACGSEPVRWSSIETFERRFDLQGVVMPSYGLGEATLGVTTHIPGEEIPVDERGNVSCGTPMWGFEVRAGDSVHNPAEILVRGGAVFAGYFDEPEESSRKIRDGWLRTGDTGYLDADGRLFVLGRREGMIKRAGSVIAPRELEDAAHRVDGVRLAAAITVPDAGEAGDSAIVVVEADAGDERSVDAITAEVTRQVVAALGFAPARVAVVPRRTIPRTENGKIRHANLRAILEGTAG